MEDKKKFLNPVIWAKHCFILVLIGFGIILFGVVAVLSEKLFGPGNCLVSLLGTLAVPFLFVALPIAFIGGLISLTGLIFIKEKAKGPYCYAIMSMTASILILYIFTMGFIKSENQAMEMLCHNTLGSLNRQIVLTFKNNNTTFKKEHWCDFIRANVEYDYDSAFTCYQDKIGPCSYAMNENIPADANALPPDLVVLFESAPDWNQTGGPQDVVADRHYKNNHGANIAFTDGHVEFVKTEDIPKLRWTIGGK